MVLGVYPFSRAEIDERDFHGKAAEDQELLIELYLDTPITTRDVYQTAYEIHGFRYRAWRQTRGDGKGVLKHEHYCFDSAGKTIVKPARIYKKPDGADDVDNTRLPVLAQDHLWNLGKFFYIDAPALEYFFRRTSGWSPLGRLFEIYREDFPASHNRYKVEEGKEMPSREALEKFSRRLSEILRTDVLLKIETELSERVKAYSGSKSDAAFRVEFALPTHREIFEEWVALQISQDAGLPPLPADRLGSGYQSLLRLAVIETLLALQDKTPCYLLIEEPEIYLHVHLRRYFAGVLSRIAAEGNTVVYTTHSPEFIDLSSPHDIVRLSRNRVGATEVRQVPEDAVFNFAKAKGKLARLGNDDLLFSRYALLAEGQDDQGVISELLDARAFDKNVHSLSIINCDGKANIADYVRLCWHFGIDFYVIHDEDDPLRDEKLNRRIGEIVREAKPAIPSLWSFKPDLESTMGEKKHCGLDRLLELLRGKAYEQIARNYPELTQPLDQFLSTRNLT